MRVLPALLLLAGCGAATGIDCRFDDPVAPGDAVVKLAAVDACIRIVHDNGGPDALCMTGCDYTMHEMTVGFEGDTERVTEAADLDYEGSHHNWDDHAHATTARGVATVDLTYSRNGDNDYSWKYVLNVVKDDGATVGPIALTRLP